MEPSGGPFQICLAKSLYIFEVVNNFSMLGQGILCSDAIMARLVLAWLDRVKAIAVNGIIHG